MNVFSDYDSVIEEAKNRIDTKLKDKPHIIALWNKVVWMKNADQRMSCDTELNSNQAIELFPSLLKKSSDEALCAILCRFGQLLFSKGSVDAKEAWQYKLALPTAGQIESVQAKLSSGQCNNYYEVWNSFTTAVDRLVALNLTNGLKAECVAFAQTLNLNLLKWGATQDYCRQMRYHSLIPLITAYAPREINDDFGAAFSAFIMNRKVVTESSVAAELNALILRILELTR